MSEREILKQYGITSQPYQDWIISNLKSEDIDEQDLEILAYERKIFH